MGMGTFCIATQASIFGHADGLHYQKEFYKWTWRHYALPRRPVFMGMQTACTVQKGHYLHAQGQCALPKKPLYMGMGTLYTAK